MACQLQMLAVIKELWQCQLDNCLPEPLRLSGSADIENCTNRCVGADLKQPWNGRDEAA